jgi:hypothetical protein
MLEQAIIPEVSIKTTQKIPHPRIGFLHSAHPNIGIL